VHERLSIYKRLADAETREALKPCARSWSTASASCPIRRALIQCTRCASPRAARLLRVDATHEAVQLQFVKNRRSTAAR